jgi:hypothetical protein
MRFRAHHLELSLTVSSVCTTESRPDDCLSMETCMTNEARAITTTPAP